MDFDLTVFVFPVLEEEPSHVSVITACEEGEDCAVFWGVCEEGRAEFSNRDFDFG